MTPSRNIIVALGRFGDAINLLPLALHLSQKGDRPIFCIAQDFATLLDGVSYCEPLVYPGRYDDPPAAVRWLKANRPRDRIILAQSYRHPSDKRHLTDSYQTEGWRLAGYLDEFGAHPLVFDQRNLPREQAFADSVLRAGKPAILVATESISSPFPFAAKLFQTIEAAFPDHAVIDLSSIRSERIYDLIALYDRAACLVSVDTVHLHLSRAAKCPVVAITNDRHEGRDMPWLGSVPPPATVDLYRYTDVLSETVVNRMWRTVDHEARHRFVVHVCDMHGHSDRHARARLTWEAAYGESDVIDCLRADWPRTAQEIGDTRNLPPLHDVFSEAVEKAPGDEDVIVFSNSDNGFTPGAFEKMRNHAAIYGAFSIRRDASHIGRDVFGFTKAWLKMHLHLIPEFWCGAPAFDLVLAAIIRKDRRIKTTKANLMVDFFPCEMEPGLVTHEAHESAWAGANEFKHPANLINLTLARRWASENKMEIGA